MPFPSAPAVAVYGAYGHTGQFVVAALRRRGVALVLSGRDAGRLHALAAHHPGTRVRPAALDSPADLDRALDGVVAVVNCAGPFGDTPPALVDTALRAGVHYLDVAGETLVARAMFDGPKPPAGVLVAPALGFFGALGDLLATAACGSGPPADAVTVAVALDSWVPTRGSQLAASCAGRRVVFTGGRLHLRSGGTPPAPFRWTTSTCRSGPVPRSPSPLRLLSRSEQSHGRVPSAVVAPRSRPRFRHSGIPGDLALRCADRTRTSMVRRGRDAGTGEPVTATRHPRLPWRPSDLVLE